MNFNKENYKFLTTRFIPEDWDFMFDIVVTLFSYVPHIISGFSEDMLTLFKDSSESILYQESFEFDLLRDDSNILFRNINGNLLDFKKITYLEELNGKYFSIIKLIRFILYFSYIYYFDILQKQTKNPLS